MGIHVKWDNPERTIIRNDFEASWTWHEFDQAMAESRKMMSEVNHPVDVIANMKPGTMPHNDNAFMHGFDAMRKWPANLGIVVVVTNPYVQAIGSGFKQVNRKLAVKLCLVTSIEEAYRLLEKQRESMKAE